MKFTPEFSLNNICKIIRGKDDLEHVIDAKKDQAHNGLFDYLEYNAGISFCEMRTSRGLRQNCFQCGLAPEQYFDLEHKTRTSLMDKVCELLQTTITREIPNQAFSSGTTILLTVSKRIQNRLHIDMAHLGDSLAFLIIENDREVLKFERLNTTLHHAGEPAESERLLKLGHVVIDGKVSKQLRHSRILGYNYFNLRKGSGQEILLREPSFVSRNLTIESNTRVRLLVCNQGIATPLKKNQSETDFIRGLYLLCRKKVFEQIPYEIVKCARQSTVTSSMTCSLIDLSNNTNCVYQTLFTGNEGPEVAIFAKNKIVTTLNAIYDELTIKKPAAIKPEYNPSVEEEEVVSSKKESSVPSKEAMFNAIENETHFLPAPSVQPGQEIVDWEPVPKRKSAPDRYSFLSSSSSAESSVPSSVIDHSSKRTRFNPKGA